MLKFQDDYTTLIATFEDFILLVYTIIDDLYQQFVPASVSQRRNVDNAKMSDSEIITLSICDRAYWDGFRKCLVFLCEA